MYLSGHHFYSMENIQLLTRNLAPRHTIMPSQMPISFWFERSSAALIFSDTMSQPAHVLTYKPWSPVPHCTVMLPPYRGLFKVIALLHSILYYISSRLKRTQHFFIIKCKPILIIWKKNMENPIKHVRINIKLFLNAYLIYWRSLINTSDAFYLRKCASALWHE